MDGITCPDIAARGSEGTEAFGPAVGHTNSNWWSLGIVVGDWGVRCEVEVSGARVGDASVTGEDIGGGFGADSEVKA